MKTTFAAEPGPKFPKGYYPRAQDSHWDTNVTCHLTNKLCLFNILLPRVSSVSARVFYLRVLSVHARIIWLRACPNMSDSFWITLVLLSKSMFFSELSPENII